MRNVYVADVELNGDMGEKLSGATWQGDVICIHQHLVPEPAIQMDGNFDKLIAVA